jgi:hypothetical protein
MINNARITAAERKQTYHHRRRENYRMRLPYHFLSVPQDHWVYLAIYTMPDDRRLTWDQMTEEEKEAYQ